MVGLIFANPHHDNVAHIDFRDIAIEPPAFIAIRPVIKASADNVGVNFALADSLAHGLNVFGHGLEVVEKSTLFGESVLSVWLGIEVREHPVHVEVSNQFFHVLRSPYTTNSTLFNGVVKG